MPVEPYFLSLVERGWHHAREASLRLAEKGTGTLHVVKGTLPGEIQQIVRPLPGIHLIGLPKTFFWPALWMLCAGGLLTRKLRGVMVDNDRSEKRVRSWVRSAVPVLRAEENESWY